MKETVIDTMGNEEARIRAAKAAYNRKYRREHADTIRENQRRYWLRKADQMEAAGKEANTNESENA